MSAGLAQQVRNALEGRKREAEEAERWRKDAEEAERRELVKKHLDEVASRFGSDVRHAIQGVYWHQEIPTYWFLIDDHELRMRPGQDMTGRTWIIYDRTGAQRVIRLYEISDKRTAFLTAVGELLSKEGWE